MRLQRADPQERFVAAARSLDPGAGDEILERVDGEIDEIPLVVDHQDSRAFVALGAEPERGLEPAELTRTNPEVPAGRPERLELTGLDPVLHGAHRHLAPARDLTRGQIAHQDLKTAQYTKNWAIPVVTDTIFYSN
jgi:hypothetical protein